MVEKDGDKLKGRFLKLNSKSYKLVSIQPFSFSEICHKALIYPDNAGANILHQRLHPEDEMEELVRPPASFSESLIDPEYRMAVIMPRDFTEDWIEEKNKAKRRSVYDEEEFEEELVVPVALELPTEPAEKEVLNIFKDSTSLEKADMQKPQEPLHALQEPQMFHQKPSFSTFKHKEDPTPEIRPHMVDEALHKESLKNTEMQIRLRLNQEMEANIHHMKDEFIENQKKLIASLSESKDAIFKNSSSKAAKITEDFLKRFFKDKFLKNAEFFVTAIEEVLRQTMTEDEFTVILNQESKTMLGERFLGDKTCNIELDDQMSFGEFKIKTAFGLIKSNLDEIIDDFISKSDL